MPKQNLIPIHVMFSYGEMSVQLRRLAACLQTFCQASHAVDKVTILATTEDDYSYNTYHNRGRAL